MDGLTWLLGAKKEPSSRALPNTTTVPETFDRQSNGKTAKMAKAGSKDKKRGLACEFCCDRLDLSCRWDRDFVLFSSKRW